MRPTRNRWRGAHGRKVGKLLRKNMRKPHFRGREGRKVTNRPRAVGVPVSFAINTFLLLFFSTGVWFLSLRARSQWKKSAKQGFNLNGHLCPLGNKFVAVSLLKPPCGVSELKPPPGSRSALKHPRGLLGSSRCNSFSRRRRRACL